MIKRLFMLLLVLLPLVAVAKTPVEQDILEQITDQRSPYYYTALMMRYTTGDQTLTDLDYHYLYYGFAYHESYKPLNTNPDEEQMMALMLHLDPDKADQALLEELLRTADAARMRDPFSPKILNVMTFACEGLGRKAEAEKWARHKQGIVRAIASSGDGLTQKSPMHVLMFGHALDMMAVEGLTHDNPRIISRTVEFIPLLTPRMVDGKKRKGVYFDFGRVYWNKPEGYTYERDRTWQFNNLKPRQYK